MQNLYLFVGASGSGKDTIVDYITKSISCKKLVSYTTRDPRYKHECTHIFVTIDDYHKMKDDGVIIADTLYQNHYYWSTEEQINAADLYIVDMDGLYKVKSRYKNKPVFVIAIESDPTIRKTRMMFRGDSPLSIATRIHDDAIAFANLRSEADVIITNNGTLKNAISQVLSFITQKENEVKRDETIIKNLSGGSNVRTYI